MILNPLSEVVMDNKNGYLNPIDLVDVYKYPGAGALPQYNAPSGPVALVEPGAGNVLLISVRENLFKNLNGLTEFGLILHWGTTPRTYGQTPEEGVYDPANQVFGGGGASQVLGELSRSSPGPTGGTVYLDWEAPIIRFPTPSLGALGLYGQGNTLEYLTRIVAPRDACRIFFYTAPAVYTPGVPATAELIVKVGYGHNCQGACQPERNG
jgi:hypothetical protein